MANRFLSNIRINDAYTFPATDGTTGQVITTDGSGNLSFSDVAFADGARSNFVYYDVKNSSGSTINKGTGVMAVGTDGNSGHILIAPMVADGSVEPKFFMGVLETTLLNGEIGKVVHFGQISQINTSTFTDGDVLWCDPANPGGFTITEPLGPNVKIAAAIVINASTNGKIKVRVQGNPGLHELHDVRITSQSDGQLLVWDNTLGVWKNNGTATIDYTNGRVGIGITNPGRKLSVAGAIELTAADSSVHTAHAAIRRGPSGEMFLDAPGDITLNIDTNNNNTDRVFNIKKDTGTELFRVQENGDIGVNITTPQGILHLNGTSTEAIQQFTTIGTGTSISDGLRIGLVGATAYFLLRENAPMLFHTNNTERMRINSDGNIGIGTSDFGLSSYAGWNNLRLGKTGNLFFNTATNTYGFAIGRNFYFASDASYKYLTTDEAERINFQNGEITFSNATSGTEDSGLSWNVNMVLNANGNLGIGTTSPSRKLHVVGYSYLNGNVGINCDAPDVDLQVNSQIRINSNGEGLMFYPVEATVPTSRYFLKFDYTDDGSYPFLTNRTPNGAVVIKTGTAAGGDENEHFRIKGGDGVVGAYFTDVNLGIGTNSPSGSLHIFNGSSGQTAVNSVANALVIEDNAANGISILTPSTQAANIFFGDESDNFVGGIRYYHNTDALAFSANNAERLRIDSVGKVGIGVVATRTFHVHSSTATDLHITNDSTGTTSTDGGTISMSGTQMIITNRENDVMRFQTNATEAMRILANGNIGIGTTLPSGKLNVNVEDGISTVKISRSGSNLTPGTALGNIIFPADYNETPTDYASIDAYANALSGVRGSLDFKVKSTSGNLLTGMTVYGTSSGVNVGVGTDSPSRKLSVQGSMYALDSLALYVESPSSGLTKTTDIEIQASGNNAGVVRSSFWKMHTEADSSYGNSSFSISKRYDGSAYSNFVKITSSGNVGVGNTNPTRKLSVNGSIEAGGKTTYTKSYPSVDTTGVIVAALTASTNGDSAMLMFTCAGGNGYQRIVYSCKNAAGNWVTSKDIDEGVNAFDVAASANGATVTFTFKGRSANQSYTPRVCVEHIGSALNTSYL